MSRNPLRGLRPTRLLAGFFLGFVSPLSGATDIPLGGKTVVHFALVTEGQKVLTTKDEFIRSLSPFDRSARMKTDKPVSEDEFLTFVGNNVTEWTTEETQFVEASLKKIQMLFRDWQLAFPATIQMIKTTGAEEGNAAYTRGTAIMIPKPLLAQTEKELTRLICHELFHILSRQNPELREQLYGVIGFVSCGDLEFPRNLASRKITNPDAPRNDHFIRLELGGEQWPAVPVLFSSSETYDLKRGGEFFDYLTFQFLFLDKENSPHPKVVYENSTAKLVGPKAVTGFFEQVGRNTQYVIHPEEILADNFALLILEEQDVPSPEVLAKMRKVLGASKRKNQQ